jgi:hypothetical protein
MNFKTSSPKRIEHLDVRDARSCVREQRNVLNCLEWTTKNTLVLQRSAFLESGCPAGLDQTDRFDPARVKPSQYALSDDKRGIFGDPVPGCQNDHAGEQIAQSLDRSIGSFAVIHIEDHRCASLRSCDSFECLHRCS